MHLTLDTVPINVSTGGVKSCSSHKNHSEQTVRQRRPFAPSQPAIFDTRLRPIDLSVRPASQAESH